MFPVGVVTVKRLLLIFPLRLSVSPSLNNFLSNLFWANFTADEINTIACAEIRFHLYFVQLTIAFFLFVLHKGFTTFTIISSIADCTESSLAL